MTTEQLDILKQFESNLVTAYNHGYTRTISRKKSLILIKVYKEVTGSQVPHSYHCQECQVSILKELYPYYFEAKEEEMNSKPKTVIKAGNPDNPKKRKITIKQAKNGTGKDNKTGQGTPSTKDSGDGSQGISPSQDTLDA